MSFERKIFQTSTLAGLPHPSGCVDVRSQQLSCQAAARCLSHELVGFLEALCPHSQETSSAGTLCKSSCKSLSAASWSQNREGRSLPQAKKPPFTVSWEATLPSQTLHSSDAAPAALSLQKTSPGLSAAFGIHHKALGKQKCWLTSCQKQTNFKEFDSWSPGLFPCITPPAPCPCWEGCSGRQSAVSIGDRPKLPCVFDIGQKTDP